MFKWLSSGPALTEMKRTLPRAELLRRGRVAILDDEAPEMLQDLINQGLAITHLRGTEDPQFQAVADGSYDLLLLDYGGVGLKFGPDEGLEVLRFLKRVNPGLRILAFTARTFDASKADFFRLCDDVVKKDAGIRETLEKIESHLSDVLTPAYQFDALVKTLGIDGEQRQELERVISKSLNASTGREKALATAKKFAKGASIKVVEAIVLKAIELGVTAISVGG
jgi:DNA-binding response OmpR family regulator